MRVLMSVTSWGANAVQVDLQADQFSLTISEDGEGLFDALHLLHDPVVVVETCLPDMDWRDTIRTLRARNPQMSLLVLHDTPCEDTVVEALSLGADDMIHCQMDGPEIGARVRAVASRRAGFGGQTLHLGPVTVRLAEQRVYWGGQRVPLRPLEYTILETLVLCQDTLVTKDHIMSALYGTDLGCDARSINVFVCQLRTNLAAAGAPKTIVQTVHGKGFRIDPTLGGMTVDSARDAIKRAA